MKENSLKVIAVLIGSFVVSLWAYHFNIYPGMQKANKQHVVFERKQPGEGEKIKINQTFPTGFSFFLEVKTKFSPGKKLHHTLLEQEEEKIRFMLTQHGDLGMNWGSEDLYWRKNTSKFHPTSFKQDKWNEIGFVYITSNSRSILTTFVNGKVLWEKYLPEKDPFIDFITLLPAKLDNQLASPFIGESRNALFLKRALSNQEVNQYYLNKKMNEKTTGISVKVLILFIICNLLFHLLLAFLKKIYTLVKREGKGKMKEDLYKLGFLLVLNGLCFVIFNLGKVAAQYFHSLPRFSSEGIYLFILNLLFFTVLFTFFLEKATGIKICRCIPLSVTIVMVFTFIWIVCTLPRFDDISPFGFNVLFAFLFTLIAGSFDILKLIDKREM
ncbi:MAG: hypothetical protein PVH61_05895 [Candidatus Aminicenantes bacterium]|jgi:hypothetical protein